uniref:Uncharacterized protein n=1 Tax=Sphaerodactylus townsendi TaxID=933632 RepID=A0ACB8F1C5_9SAUR
MGLPYSWASSRRLCWEAKVVGWRVSTWLTQPIDQDIYSEWDPAAQSEWSRAQVRAGAWAPERDAVTWRRERDEMRQEIHFLRCNMELLLARAEAAERDPGVVQDWQEQVKIHFFREGLHPELAQWAMVTAEPTSLAG